MKTIEELKKEQKEIQMEMTYIEYEYSSYCRPKQWFELRTRIREITKLINDYEQF